MHALGRTAAGAAISLWAAAALLLLPTAAAANPFAGGWTLAADNSTLAFQSVKNNTVVETSRFAILTGGIGEDGAASVEIALDSVDTGIDLRNVRMRFLFFETFRFPAATVRMTVDPAMLEGLETKRRITVAADYTLDLHGVTKAMRSDVVVTLIGPDMVSVASAGPIAVRAEDFALAEGVLKLQDAAKVTIVPMGSVSFDFMFTRGPQAAPAPALAEAAPAPAAAPPPTTVALETQGAFSREECVGRFEILSRSASITFASGSAAPTQESGPFLAAILDIVQRCPGLAIEVGGHTDDIGGEALNQRLSEARAEAVARYLTNSGVEPERVTSRGYGEARPAYPNDSLRHRALNRRIEFSALADG